MEQKINQIFKDMGFVINQIRFLSPKEAYQVLISGVTLIDMRKEYETNYRIFDVPGVIYISKEEILNQVDSLNQYTPLILADNVGLNTKTIAQKLMTEGVSNFACLIGGMVEWMNDKLPVKKDPNYALTGQCSCQLKLRKKR